MFSLPFVVNYPLAWFDSLLMDGQISQTLSTELVNVYTQHHRAYHNLHHVASMWQMQRFLSFNENKVFSGEECVKLARAITFHDFIYDPKSKTNEEDSCAFIAANSGLKNEWVQRAILTSKDHFTRRDISTRDDELIEWFIGLDLCGLAAPFEIFLMNTRQLRSEYSHLTEDEWRAGRISFYEKALERRPIFQHPIFEKNFEDNAIINLERVLKC